jgi:CAAX protease family protein
MADMLMFPAMLLGPSVVGIALIVLVDGRASRRELFLRMRRVRFPLRIPPALVLTILLFLKAFVSSVYAPNRFWIGVLFGIPAGFFEEIGWMGFVFPKMREKLPALSAAVLLGSSGASGTCPSSITWEPPPRMVTIGSLPFLLSRPR